MEIVVGTYEELLLGYTLVKINDEYQLQQSFTDHTHTGCVKCVASQKNLLVSGSTDESIRVFDLKKRRELGTLLQHSGTVTSLEFYTKSHLFSTSEDGTLCVWRVSGWEAIRTFRGHKGPVNCVSVHPSGKLAVTVSRDRTLRLWNLVDGRPAFTSNIKHEAEIVVWSPDGNFYVVSWNNSINVHSVDEGKIHASIDASRRVNSIVFIEASIMAYAGEGGDIFFHNIVDGTPLSQLSTGTARIRGLAASPSHENPTDPSEVWLTVASSDGHIKVYRISLKENKIETELLSSHNTTFRLTCVTATKPEVEQCNKKKRKGTKTDEPDAKKLKSKADEEVTVKTEPDSETETPAISEEAMETVSVRKKKADPTEKKKKKKKKKVQKREKTEKQPPPKDAGTLGSVEKQKKRVQFGEVKVREIRSTRQLIPWDEQKAPVKRAPALKMSKTERLKQKKLNKKLKRQQKHAKRRS